MLHGHARDNAVSALGKIIKHQHAQIDIATTLPIWIDALPLKYDTEEAQIMHELLTDFFIQSSDMFMPYLEKVVVALGSVLETDFVNERTTSNIK